MGKLAGDQTDSIDSHFLSLMAVGVITNTLSTRLQGHRLQCSEYTLQPGAHSLCLSLVTVFC